ncbi:hypothetical protein LC613_30770 [Nostoc sphaeroides CHAB 2801]|uniref:hypothetical protein n=1 Tax=Nostoc sphaeroides TaxID=446679 RepID=UPI001E46C908|nr:hypothetical protein [Nostoc sphaeroides]MCC5632062.1 hypothetical protein [Nostoc sphaeroides CHAB 2801]
MASLTANFFKSAANLVSVIDEVLKIFDNFVFLSDFIELIRDYKFRRLNSTLTQNVGDDFDIYQTRF